MTGDKTTTDALLTVKGLEKEFAKLNLNVTGLKEALDTFIKNEKAYQKKRGQIIADSNTEELKKKIEAHKKLNIFEREAFKEQIKIGQEYYKKAQKDRENAIKEKEELEKRGFKLVTEKTEKFTKTLEKIFAPNLINSLNKFSTAMSEIKKQADININNIRKNDKAKKVTEEGVKTIGGTAGRIAKRQEDKEREEFQSTAGMTGKKTANATQTALLEQVKFFSWYQKWEKLKLAFQIAKMGAAAIGNIIGWTLGKIMPRFLTQGLAKMMVKSRIGRSLMRKPGLRKIFQGKIGGKLARLGKSKLGRRVATSGAKGLLKKIGTGFAKKLPLVGWAIGAFEGITGGIKGWQESKGKPLATRIRDTATSAAGNIIESFSFGLISRKTFQKGANLLIKGIGGVAKGLWAGVGFLGKTTLKVGKGILDHVWKNNPVRHAFNGVLDLFKKDNKDAKSKMPTAQQLFEMTPFGQLGKLTKGFFGLFKKKSTKDKTDITKDPDWIEADKLEKKLKEDAKWVKKHGVKTGEGKYEGTRSRFQEEYDKSQGRNIKAAEGFPKNTKKPERLEDLFGKIDKRTNVTVAEGGEPEYLAVLKKQQYEQLRSMMMLQLTPGFMNFNTLFRSIGKVVSRAFKGLKGDKKAVEKFDDKNVKPQKDASGLFTKANSSVDMEGLKPFVKNRLFSMLKEFKDHPENPSKGKPTQINSANRTYEAQQKLYQQALAERSQRGYMFASKPTGKSDHETGQAVDINTWIVNVLDKIGLLNKWGFTRHPAYAAKGVEGWHLGAKKPKDEDKFMAREGAAFEKAPKDFMMQGHAGEGAFVAKSKEFESVFKYFEMGKQLAESVTAGKLGMNFTKDAPGRALQQGQRGQDTAENKLAQQAVKLLSEIKTGLAKDKMNKSENEQKSEKDKNIPHSTQPAQGGSAGYKPKSEVFPTDILMTNMYAMMTQFSGGY